MKVFAYYVTGGAVETGSLGAGGITVEGLGTGKWSPATITGLFTGSYNFRAEGTWTDDTVLSSQVSQKSISGQDPANLPGCKLTWDKNYPWPEPKRIVTGKGTYDGVPGLEPGNAAAKMVLWPTSGGKVFEASVAVIQNGGQPNGTFSSQAVAGADRSPTGPHTVIVIGTEKTVGRKLSTPSAIVTVVD